MLRELHAYVHVICILTKGYLSSRICFCSTIWDNQAHAEPKLLVFLEFTHTFETLLIAFPKAQGMLTKFYDHLLHFVSIIRHINGSFVREGSINVILGGHISLLGVCFCSNTRLITGRSLELGFLKCIL